MGAEIEPILYGVPPALIAAILIIGTVIIATLIWAEHHSRTKK